MSVPATPVANDNSGPVNILLVDDQPAKLLSYEVILGELGENLLKATSPREAFAQLLRTDVAVVLMDVQMPELDGFELANMIREHPRFERTAIIFVSAIHLTEFDRLKGYAAGAVDYLSVPIVPEVLRAKVRIFIELYRKTRQLERINEELESRVTERTVALELSNRRLQASERRRSLALAAGSMGSWDWNTATGEMSWDEGQCRIFGVDPGTFVATSDSVARLVHPDDRASLQAAIERTLRGEGDLHQEFRAIRADGVERWCITSGTAAPDEDGRPVHLTGVTYDVTEEKQAKAALESLNSDLEQRIDKRTQEREAALAQLFESKKTEAIGQLTGGVAHDFNNLLMAVLGSLELVLKRVDEPRTIRLVQNAFDAAQRGAALTRRLLAFARRQELKPEAVDLANLVSGMEDLVRRAIGPSIALQVAVPSEVPAVYADQNQLELALLNLAVNARDAMPEGGSLRIMAMEDDRSIPLTGLPHGTYVRLCITDTGIGMDQETLSHAAEPFFTTKGPGKGTGLGLSMVHGMVAQSGGALRLASDPGEGTTVSIWLPVASAETRQQQRVHSAEPAPAEAIEPLTILLVDDDDLVRAGAVEMLEDLGHLVIATSSGEEALAVLGARDDIGLLLTDHLMPGMKGLELIDRVKCSRPTLPSLLASGYAESTANGHVDSPRLTKPFTQADLQNAIVNVLLDHVAGRSLAS